MRLSPVSPLSICWHPPPRPASGLLPRPRGGSRGDTRGGPHPGERTPVPAFSSSSPPYPGLWVISPRGVGQTGGHAPLSCLWLQYTPTPPGLFFKFPPIPWTVGDISTGGGADGEGAKSPLPCLFASHMPASPTPPLSLCSQYAGIPHPARPPASSPSYHLDRPWVVCGEGIYLLALAPSIKTPQPETDTEMFP